jgi:DNA-binding MarR family transcriptional regulator
MHHYNYWYNANVVADRRRVPDRDLDLATRATLTASRALVGVAARSLAAIEGAITLPQYRALVLLSYGEQTVGNLAGRLDIHPSTATRLCDRLLGRELIERSTSKESRREVVVRLSRDGERVVRDVAARRRREVRRIIGQLNRRDQQRVAEGFALFAAAAGELPDEAWRLGWQEE